MKVVHQKLVRDLIPEKITGQGHQANFEYVTDDQRYEKLLLEKLIEEAKEAESAPEEMLLEELADMQSVITAILTLKGWSPELLLEQQRAKDVKNGVFGKRIFLKEVELKEE